MKTICNKKLGTTCVRGVVNCNCYGSLHISPHICEQNKSWNNCQYNRVLNTSQKDEINVFSWSLLSIWYRLNVGIDTSKSWGTICKNWGKKVGRPKKNFNPVSSSPEQTWCISKGEKDITRTNYKLYSTTKDGHYWITKDGAKNKWTTSKGGYTKKPEHTIL